MNSGDLNVMNTQFVKIVSITKALKIVLTVKAQNLIIFHF